MREWKTVTIGEVCEILDHKRIPLNAQQRHKMQGNIPYYGANGVQGYINKHIFNEELILLAEDGGNFEQFENRPIAYKISGKSWVNNHAHILKANEGYDQDFVFYKLVHKNILFFIKGGTRSKLNKIDLLSITIEFPTKREQQKIAQILTKADEAIQQTERLIAKYEAIRTGLMQDLLTRGIDEAGNVRSEETHAFKDSELGRIPVEWEVESLKNLAQIIDPQPDHRTPPADPDGFPYVGIGDITEDGRIDKKCRRIIRAALSKQQSRFTIDTGDIIFGKIGTIGKPQSINETKDIALSANIILIKPLRNNQLVLEILKSDFTRRQIKNTIHTTTQPAFGMGKTRALQFAWPNLPKERNQIELTLTQNSKILQEANMQLEKLTALKTALMQDLLTGNKRVDDLLD
jgi:type I restriction enzyme S subunit